MISVPMNTSVSKSQRKENNVFDTDEICVSDQLEREREKRNIKQLLRHARYFATVAFPTLSLGIIFQTLRQRALDIECNTCFQQIRQLCVSCSPPQINFRLLRLIVSEQSSFLPFTFADFYAMEGKQFQKEPEDSDSEIRFTCPFKCFIPINN